jgi:hypothetical protein
MTLSLVLYFLGLLTITFCCYQKKLHLFEIFFIWMTVWLITHFISTILIINFRVLEVSSGYGNFGVHFFKRFILFPQVIVIMFDIYLRLRTTLLRILSLIATVFLLSGLEFLFIYLGVLINLHHRFIFSLLEWSITVLLALLTWKWYRYKRLMRYS